MGFSRLCSDIRCGQNRDERRAGGRPAAISFRESPAIAAIYPVWREK
jgi:hypothetical protein